MRRLAEIVPQGRTMFALSIGGKVAALGSGEYLRVSCDHEPRRAARRSK